MTSSPLFQRSELLLGPAVMERLAATRVILFGVGGVGSWAAEGLVRSGLGHLTMVDSDHVCITNINRQCQASTHTVGEVKVVALAERLRAINPDASIAVRQEIYNLATRDGFGLETFDYVIDAIDSLSPKLGLIMQVLQLRERSAGAADGSANTPARAARAPVLFASMGASSKLDPTRVRVASIWKSAGDPLARRIRKRLFRHGVRADFDCVYSEEQVPNEDVAVACGSGTCLCPRLVQTAQGPARPHEWCSSKRQFNGSVVQVTAAFGMCLVSMVVNDVRARVLRAADAGASTTPGGGTDIALASKRTIDIAIHADDADIGSAEEIDDDQGGGGVAPR